MKKRTKEVVPLCMPVQKSYTSDATENTKGIMVKECQTLLKIKSNHSLPLCSYLARVFKTLDRFRTDIEWTTTSACCILVGISNASHIAEITRNLSGISVTETSDGWNTICILDGPEEMKRISDIEMIGELNRHIALRMISFSEQNNNLYITLRPENQQKALQIIYNHLFITEFRNC